MLRGAPWILWLALSAIWIGFWLWFLGRAGISVRADRIYLWIVFGTPFAVLAGTIALVSVLAHTRGHR